MKITEVYVEVKKSKNFQTYAVGYKGTLESNDDMVKVRKELQQMAREGVMEQIAADSAGSNPLLP